MPLDRGYPQVPDEMLPGMGGEMGAEGEGDNPVFSALNTVGTFVKAQSEQGNPAAAEAMQAFQQFLQAMAKLSGGGQEPVPQAGAPAPELNQAVERSANSRAGAVPVL